MRSGHLLALAALTVLPAACGGRGEEIPPTRAGVERCAAVEDLFERASCFADLAERWKDLGVCDSATHEGVRYSCYAAFAERRLDPRACQAIPATSEEHIALRDRCLSGVSKQRGDADLCGAVSGAGARDGCYLAAARDTGNRLLCEKIAEGGLRRICEGGFSSED